MEEDIHKGKIQSKTATINEDLIKKRIDIVIEQAQERINIEAANNPEIRFALDIVEEFIRRKGRVCYGGTAMNAQLSKEQQFYSPDKDLPDYDFFTYDLENDVKELVRELKKSGFDDVSDRFGIHEGSKKIFVNYIAVADITTIDHDIYDILKKRAVIINGIRYTDPDILRMMMYLELSRPKGEVSRWNKVYERLALINKAFPMKKCGKDTHLPRKIPTEVRDIIHNFCINHKRTLAGTRLEKIYSRSLRAKEDIKWLTKEGGAVVFYSPDPKKDALILRQNLGFHNVDVRYYEKKGDIIPARLVLRLHSVPIALIVQETACHSYNTLKDPSGNTIHIASLSTLISLYLSLAIFTNDEEKIFGFSLLCVTQRFIEVNDQLQNLKVVKQFPPFSLDCHGYQKGFPSLIREKVQRIAGEKLKKRLLTRKREISSTNKTVKKKKSG